MNSTIAGKINKVIFIVLFTMGLITGWQDINAQTVKESVHYQDTPNASPVISKLMTLSIHVRDSITHDSVFHFLVDKLKLPVYYYPVGFGKRKYAGAYAGNLILEPCGPYSNFAYASNDFRAIFFGLTFESNKSMTSAALDLTGRKIQHKVTGDLSISFDGNMLSGKNILCGENITINLMDKSDKYIDRMKMDSLRNSMNNYSGNELGIEYVKGIQIGYKDKENLEKWKDLIYPSVLMNNGVWSGNDNLEFHFVKDNIREVASITFKVKSLGKARRYLTKNNLIGSVSDGKIEINKSKSFGLAIYLME